MYFPYCYLAGKYCFHDSDGTITYWRVYKPWFVVLGKGPYIDNVATDNLRCIFLITVRKNTFYVPRYIVIAAKDDTNNKIIIFIFLYTAIQDHYPPYCEVCFVFSGQDILINQLIVIHNTYSLIPLSFYLLVIYHRISVFMFIL